jgi:hypothetical protein
MKTQSMIKRLWPLFLSIVVVSAAIFIYFNPPNSIDFAGLQVEYLGSDQYASVFLDNQYLEKAPLANRNIRSGDYILKIVPDDQNLAEFSTPITLTTGTLTVVSYKPGLNSKESSATIYEIEKVADLKDFGQVSFESYPEHALLSFDQQATQYTPIIIENLAPQEYKYRVTLPSYEAQEHTLQVLAGYTIKASIKLAKLSENPLDQKQINTIIEKDSTASDSAQIANEQDESWGVTDPKAITGDKVRIKKTGFFVDNQEVLRVRAAANLTASELGFAKSDFYYPVAEIVKEGEGKENGDMAEDDNLTESVDSSSSAQIEDWLKIKFEGQEGWVSAQFAELVVD